MNKPTKPIGLPSSFLPHILLVLAFLLSACGRTIDWKQEVKLHDGRVIVLERKSKQTDVILPEKQTIEPWQLLAFKNPNTSESISFEIPKGLRIWMLDFEGNATYAALKPASVADYNTWGCPNPPWVAYQYLDGHWTQIHFTQLPISFVSPNVLPAAASGESISMDGLVTPSEFDAFLKASHKLFQSTSREKINPIAHGCHQSVLYQQGRESEIDTRR